MCRLVGWVSKSPRTLAEILGEGGVAELEALSRQHADGWGMAWWDGSGERAELHSLTSHLPAHASASFKQAAQDVRSDAAIVHLRWATPGLAVAPENTHPFVFGDWAFAHNGAVRPADGLLPLLTEGEREMLRGETDSERLLHVLLGGIRTHGASEGIRRTIADVTRDLTPSSLNSLLLGSHALTAVCAHAGPSEHDPLPADAPPEDRPGYFDLRWRMHPGAVVVASEPLGSAAWERLENGTALVAERVGTGGGSDVRIGTVGTFPPEALARERDRRHAAAAVRAAERSEMRVKPADPMLGR